MTVLRRSRLLWAAALFSAVFFMASGIGGMAWFHFGNPAKTCAACHEMAEVHSAWSESSHRTLHCRNCHGGSLTLDAHALHAHLNRVVQHFRASPDQPIRLREEQVLAMQESCRACHPQSFADWQASRHSAPYARMFLNATHNESQQLAPECLRCHGMFFDGHIDDLVMPISTQGPWALRDPTKATQPVIPCLACHQNHTPAAGFRSAQLYVRHERASLPADRLPIVAVTQGERAVRVSSDPRQRLCAQCHTPNAFRRLGSSMDRTPAGVHEGLSCLDCHSSHSNSAKASCVACHPAQSHCGLNVEQMDTTFVSLESKHNLHFVGCGDCHNGQRPPARK